MKRIGIVGTGSIGRVHARHAARVGLPVAAAWDPKPTAVEAFRAEQPKVDVEPSIERLLATAGLLRRLMMRRRVAASHVNRDAVRATAVSTPPT